MERLWSFLKSNVLEEIHNLESALIQTTEDLNAISLDVLREDTVAHRLLRDSSPNTLRDVQVFLAAAAVRRDACNALHQLEGAPSSSMPRLPASPSGLIAARIQDEKDTRDAVLRENIGARVEQLKARKRLLEHRRALSSLLPEVESFIQRQRWALKATKAKGNTSHITKAYNTMFNELVTMRYLELFQDAIRAMGRSVLVKVDTYAQKGEVYRQIVVEKSKSVASNMATPERVLSEGEKRAVALADFLTEVALDTGSGCIVLDDPVTSLDLEWRSDIARMLAQEAVHRQVVIFTHDLPFLYQLKLSAKEAAVSASYHWITRGGEDDRPGYVVLNDSPALEPEYKSAQRSREFYSQAKAALAGDQEAILRQGFSALRSCYEAFVVFDLFNRVIQRFDPRIEFASLKEIVIDPDMVTEVSDGFSRISRYIDGHLHSDALGDQRPSLTALLREIETFEDLRKRLRALKAAQKKNSPAV